MKTLTQRQRICQRGDKYFVFVCLCACVCLSLSLSLFMCVCVVCMRERERWKNVEKQWFLYLDRCYSTIVLAEEKAGVVQEPFNLVHLTLC